MDKTYQEVVLFVNTARVWMQEHDTDTKLRSALRKVVARCMTLLEAQNEAIVDIELEHCSTDDKTKIILKDERDQFRYTKDAMKKRNAAIRELRAKPLEIAPLLVNPADLPDGLTGAERDAFAGFVLAEEPDEDAGLHLVEHAG